MHKTRIIPIEMMVRDDTCEYEVITFRVSCSCGYASPVPLLNQSAANRVAREHREAFDDGPRLHMGLEP